MQCDSGYLIGDLFLVIFDHLQRSQISDFEQLNITFQNNIYVGLATLFIYSRKLIADRHSISTFRVVS